MVLVKLGERDDAFNCIENETPFRLNVQIVVFIFDKFPPILGPEEVYR